jgi:hypothetical protein
MHGDASFGGPIAFVIVGLLIVAAALAVFVVLDAVRRARLPGSRPAEPLRWFYLVPQGLYLAVLFASQVPATPAAVAVIAAGMTPFALGLGVAYLLNVVFPKPTVRDTEPELLDDGGDTTEREGGCACGGGCA